jgi:hypothetical protein
MTARRAHRQNAPGLWHQQTHILHRHRRDLSPLVGLRVRRFELPSDQGKVGACLFCGDAGLQAAFDEHPSQASAFEPCLADRRRNGIGDANSLHFLRRLNGYPQIWGEQRHDTGEPRRCDARDRIWQAAQREYLSRDREVAPELTLPQAIGDHQDPRRARLIVGWHEQATKKGRYAEHREVIRCDDLPERHARSFAEAQRRHHRAVAEHVAEDSVLCLEVEEVLIGARPVLAAVTGGCKYIHERSRRGHWQWPKHQRVDQRKHRRVYTHAESQRQDRHRRKTWASPHPSQRVANVFQ